MRTRTEPPRLKVVVFDVDGTLADTERDGHRPAFNEAFKRHGLDINWDAEEYGRLLRITGGCRRVASYLRERGYGPSAEAVADAVHQTKTELFAARVASGGVVARAGVTELVHELARAGVRIAVATTGRRAWVEPLVSRLLGAGAVEVMVTGDAVTELKPDPEVYLRALGELGVDARDALAVEDSEVGLRSATAAGLATVVVTNGYTAGGDFSGAAEVRPGFDGPAPMRAAHCVAVHRSWWI
ncbi:MAG TPA: HAD-IA family hydrolase [Pseudonocardia sp.]|uniref:HAD-IA family hydrolase n=1 Tax=Pseudonocardia sp. TaxID=60912 RepID=UPI002CC5DD81|nr:HAD-IA family hydrolase [Pseudonocardia sp.]HTF54069.1 HAD-IA family hydrolase [Pseudonocardia sp.]